MLSACYHLCPCFPVEGHNRHGSKINFVVMQSKILKCNMNTDVNNYISLQCSATVNNIHFLSLLSDNMPVWRTVGTSSIFPACTLRVGLGTLVCYYL